MVDKPLPRDVWVARDLLCADLSRAWRVSDLARMCAVPRRSLEKHFRHFLGCTPLKFLQAERLGEARRKLLRAPLSATVTRIAIECGFPHLGRFAIAYRDHFGESPSATLRFSRARVRAQSRVRHIGPVSIDQALRYFLSNAMGYMDTERFASAMKSVRRWAASDG